MKNTIKFGATARLDNSFEHLAHASAAASAGEADFDFDAEDDESDAEDEDESEEDEDFDGDDESEEDDIEDEDSEDESEEDFEDEDEGDDESEEDEEDFESEDEDEDESDAEDDFYEEEIDAEDEDDTFEEVIADDEGDEDEGDDEVSEAEVIASLEAQGLCFVIASSEDEILESDMAEAVASMEDDEFEDDTFEEVLADDEDEDEDTFEEVIASDDEEFEDEDESDFESEDEDESEEDESEDDDIEDEDESEEEEEDFESDDEGDDESEEDDESDADEDEFEIDAEDEGNEDDEFEAESEEDDEFLAPVATEEFLASATADEVEFHLSDDPKNPVLNVIVASVPAARITLASFGAQASEMSDIFRSERYTQGLRVAMAKQGVLNLLKKAKAEFYATAYRSSDIFEEAVASAEAVSGERIAVAMSGLREDFVDAIQLVSAGMDKNFFQIENPLKRALYINMAQAGVLNPMEVIEASFAEASAPHFEAVVAKAVEIMDKSAEAREDLRAAIGESGVIDRSAGASSAQASAIATAAEESSAVAIAREIGASHTVSASTKNGQKDQIRGLFHAR